MLNKSNYNPKLDLNSEIISLKTELYNKNLIIEQKDMMIMDLKNQLNIINISYKRNLSLIEKLQHDLNQKELELYQLNKKLNSIQGKTSSENKWGFAICLKSSDESKNYPMICNEKDSISRLEEELYNVYPKFKEHNTYLTCNGEILKRFKTVGENNIKKGDIIIVNIYE